MFTIKSSCHGDRLQPEFGAVRGGAAAEIRDVVPALGSVADEGTAIVRENLVGEVEAIAVVQDVFGLDLGADYFQFP